jgi:ribonuclease HI
VDDDLASVVEREWQLLDPSVRQDADAVRALLHPDFVEYGASGRVWDRSSVTTVTAGPPGLLRAWDVHPRRLGPDAVLVTYRSSDGTREALRSSTWVRQDGGWVLLFHQGTPTR